MALTAKQKEELKIKFFTPTPGSTGGAANRISAMKKATGFDTSTSALDEAFPSTGRITQAEKDRAANEDAETEAKPGFFARTVERLKKGGEKIKSVFQTNEAGKKANLPSAIIKTAGTGVSAIAGTAFDALVSVAKPIIKTVVPYDKEITKYFGEKGKDLLRSETGQKGLSALQKGEEAYNEFKLQHPSMAATIEGLFGIAEAVPLSKGASLLKTGATELTEQAGKFALKQTAKVLGKESIEEGAQKLTLRGALEARKLAKTAAKVEEKINPTLTKNEIRLAREQGRVVESKGLKKFFGVPDELVSERKVQNAAETFARRIPNAEKLSDQQIINTAEREVKKIATDLEPKLQKIKYSDETIEKIVDSYEEMQKKQINNSPILEPGQIKKAQDQFQNIVADLINNEKNSADDLWKAVRRYDSEVPKNVKESTELSDEKLQELKDIWLENRRVLRDALDETVDNATEIDDVLKQNFRDMYGLYTARENVVNNARFNKGALQKYKKLLITAGVSFGAGATGVSIYKGFAD